MKRFAAFYLAVMCLTLFLPLVERAGAIALRPLDIMMGLAIMGGVGMVAVRKRNRKIGLRFDPLLLFLLVFVAYLFVNGLFLSTTAVAVKDLIQRMEFFALAVMVAGVVRDTRMRGVFLHTLYIGFLLLALYTTAWHVYHGQFAMFKQLGVAKLAFGALTVFTYSEYVLQSKKKGGGQGAMLASIYFWLSVALLALSGERKAWAGVMAAMVLIYLFQRSLLSQRFFKLPRLKTFARVTSLLVVGGLVLSVLIRNDEVQQQVESTINFAMTLTTPGSSYKDMSTSSNKRRFLSLQSGLSLMKENLLFGTGTDQYRTQVGFYIAREHRVLSAHNDYVKHGTENGLIGLFLYVALWVMIMRRFFSVAYACERLHIGANSLLYKQLLFSVGLFAYGAVVNLFLSAGAMGIFLLHLPIGLAVGFTRVVEDLERN